MNSDEKSTIDELPTKSDVPKTSAVKKSLLRINLLITVFAVALGTNFSIYNNSVVNNLTPIVIKHINETRPMHWLVGSTTTPERLWAIVISSFFVGSAVGTLCSPVLAEWLGRKKGLLISASINILGGLIGGFYLYVFELALIGRILMGFSLGLGMPLSASFVSEISPVDRRGQLSAVLQLAFALGDLCGMLFSTTLVFGTLLLSPFALSFTSICSFVQFVIICLSHDSPRYLILHCRRLTDGKLALQYYQGKEASMAAFKDILSETKRSAEQTTKNTQNGSDQWKKSSCPSLKTFASYFIQKPFLLASLLMILVALTGKCPVMAFSTDVYLTSGMPHYVELCTLALGVSNFFGSILAVHLMESIGRKTMLITGVIGAFCSILGYTVISLILSHGSFSPYWSYSLAVSLTIFLLFYSLVGAAGNTLTAEICPQTYRSLGVSLGVFWGMIISILLIMLYGLLKTYAGYAWVFFPSSPASLLIGLYLYRQIPETKDKTITEIMSHFKK